MGKQLKLKDDYFRKSWKYEILEVVNILTFFCCLSGCTFNSRLFLVFILSFCVLQNALQYLGHLYVFQCAGVWAPCWLAGAAASS